MLPQLIEIDSRALKAVAWENDTLFLKFNNGKLYKYKEVDRAKFDGIMGAKSAGEYYNAYIKGKHASEEIPEDEASVGPS